MTPTNRARLVRFNKKIRYSFPKEPQSKRITILIVIGKIYMESSAIV